MENVRDLQLITCLMIFFFNFLFVSFCFFKPSNYAVSEWPPSSDAKITISIITTVDNIISDTIMFSFYQVSIGQLSANWPFKCLWVIFLPFFFLLFDALVWLHVHFKRWDIIKIADNVKRLELWIGQNYQKHQN